MASPSPFRTLPAERRLALVTHALTNHKGARATYVQRLLRAAVVFGPRHS